jgi:lipoprotein Spr
MIKNKIILMLVVLLPILGYSQTKKKLPALDSLPYLTADTTLNNFMLHWLGKPYRLGGTTERGIDCSQFNKRLAKDVFKIELQSVCYKQWNETERIKKDSLAVGDLVFFRSRQSPSGWHCGTYIGETMFVHAANRYEGVKISSLLEPKYKRAYKGAGRK